MKLFVLKDFTSAPCDARPRMDGSYDVVVVGLGSGGFYAAEKSALLGLKTMGVERMSEMGGQATIGCVCGTEDNCRAVLSDMEKRAKAAGFERAMETTVIGVWMEGRAVVGVRLLKNGFVRDVRAKVIIDATGNAAVSRMAGCAVRVGRMSDNGQGATSKASIFRLENGKTQMGYGFYRDSAECEGEAFSRKILGYAANDVKTLGKRTVVRKSPLMGAREEGHVDCEDTYTLKDAIVARRVVNPIFSIGAVPNDLVRIDADWAWENEDTVTWKEICELHNFAYHADMPYGAIVPRGVDGLLEAGKHYGVAHDAGGGLRMKEHMRFLGVAAAAAAKVAIKRGCRLKDVPYAELRPLLEKSAFRPRKYAVNSIYRWQLEEFDAAAVVKALKRPRVQIGTWVQRCERGDAEEAAWAYFTCWRMYLTGTAAEQRALADALAAGLADEGGEHLAIALALLRDTRGVERLLACAQGTGDFHDRIKALAALRILRTPAARPLFAAILADDAVSFAGTDAKGARWGFAHETTDYRRFLALSYAIFGLRELGVDVSAWRTKPLKLSCGARDSADLAPQLKAACRPDPFAYEDRLRDHCWMWGHDSGYYDGTGPSSIYNLPLSAPISMPDACAYMGIPNVCAVTWDVPDEKYLEPFRKMKRVSWVLCGHVSKEHPIEERFYRLRDNDFLLLDKLPNLVGLDLDDYFRDKADPERYRDALGREVDLCCSVIGHENLADVRRRLDTYARPVDLRAVVYIDKMQQCRDYCQALRMFDTVLAWTWTGANLAALRKNFAHLRELAPGKRVLMGIYMWDFGGKGPLKDEFMKSQLDIAHELYHAHLIDGFIFHCTPLVNKNPPLKAVEMARAWIREHGEETRGA